MASTYYFAAAPGSDDIMNWFRAQPDQPQEHLRQWGTALFYSQFGKLVFDSSGEADPSKSPVVTIFHPRVRRSVLWTVGEVHFRAINAAQHLPAFDRFRKRFQNWIKQQPIVWDRADDGKQGHGHYFEGGVTNVAEKIYALNSALTALADGKYFVADGTSEPVLDTLCKQLRLRGIACG